MAPPVVRDDAIASLAEEQHLSVPVVRAQWPAVRENDRLARCPSPCNKSAYRLWS